MKLRTLGLLLLAGLAFVLVLSMASQQASAQPPVNGDWVISGAETHTDEDFTVNGTIWVQDGARLTLEDTIIRMNSGFSGEFGIVVEDGGTLLIRDNSVITTYSGWEYVFEAQNGSRLEIIESSVMYCGYDFTGNGSQAGVFIDTDDATIQDSEFIMNFVGIVVNSQTATIEGNHFEDNLEAGLHVFNTSLSVPDSHFRWNKRGISVVEGHVDITNSTFTNNWWGVHAFDNDYND